MSHEQNHGRKAALACRLKKSLFVTTSIIFKSKFFPNQIQYVRQDRESRHNESTKRAIWLTSSNVERFGSDNFDWLSPSFRIVCHVKQNQISIMCSSLIFVNLRRCVLHSIFLPPPPSPIPSPRKIVKFLFHVSVRWSHGFPNFAIQKITKKNEKLKP